MGEKDISTGQALADALAIMAALEEPMMERTSGGTLKRQEISGENMAVLRDRIFGKGPFAKLREDPNWRPSRKGNGR